MRGQQSVMFLSSHFVCPFLLALTFADHFSAFLFLFLSPSISKLAFDEGVSAGRLSSADHLRDVGLIFYFCGETLFVSLTSFSTCGTYNDTQERQ